MTGAVIFWCWRIQKSLKNVEMVPSGYVHGAYPHIMELYSSGLGFHTKGMRDTPLQYSSARRIAGSLHFALSQFAGIALSVGEKRLFFELRDRQKQLETSSIYP